MEVQADAEITGEKCLKNSGRNKREREKLQPLATS